MVKIDGKKDSQRWKRKMRIAQGGSMKKHLEEME